MSRISTNGAALGISDDTRQFTHSVPPRLHGTTPPGVKARVRRTPGRTWGGRGRSARGLAPSLVSGLYLATNGTVNCPDFTWLSVSWYLVKIAGGSLLVRALFRATSRLFAVKLTL